MNPPWPFARTLIQRDLVASTSDLARELVLEDRLERPLVVWAKRQTNGRGRGPRRWWSDAGSLTFTIALDSAAHGLRTDHEPRLALATAVAVIDAIEPLAPGLGLGIRWPNDVEAGRSKLAGILPERLETCAGTRLLIGIGVNVATRLDDAPPEVRRMAASLVELIPQEDPPERVERLLRAILGGFGGQLERLARDDQALAARWAELDTLRGRPVRVDLGSRIVAGLGRGIDAEGALCVAAEEGEIRLFGGQVIR